MRNINNLKVGVIFSLLLFLYTNSFAQNYIINDGNLIDIRAKNKIIEIGNEVKERLGVNIYVYTVENLGLEKNISTKDKIEYIKVHEENIIKNLETPYVLMTLSLEDTHVNLYTSDNIKKIIDKNDILDDYVVPLLASKDKNSTASKVSAAILNGYAAIADKLADQKNIELESSIGNQGRVASTIWRVLIYFVILTALFAYVYAVLRKRK
ncbi:hypothetical protein [Arcobacter porcinus]|uniref:TPM domain-containing protein n=1 Tax=Arcobacter porcinus TaxID=1935204 RepID=A0ABX2YAZ0_9BACT|nr:hypothetical protein [Arcobacter porcinus]OCL84534.1 hypothetical protein AAW29_00207 [Arcobacter porcinus]OCL89076.1 hypothetical protein AAX30_00208 [Arcobacter porcinus]OCL91496.1 hypothetical protein AAX28_01236 [Arcobacter porcinus]